MHSNFQVNKALSGNGPRPRLNKDIGCMVYYLNIGFSIVCGGPDCYQKHLISNVTYYMLYVYCM